MLKKNLEITMRIHLFFLLLLMTGCGIVPDLSMREKDVAFVELGTIGSIKTNETSTQFNTAAIPVLNEKVRISVNERSFDKSSSKKYNKVQNDKSQQIIWEDSIHSRANYIDLAIGDKVTWLRELNAPINNDITVYLRSAHEPVLISSVSIAANVDVHSELMSAEEVYLVNNDRKKYLLELFVSQKRIKTIELSSALLFDYSTKNFCWIENEKHEIIISDINNAGCKKPMSQTYQKVEKKKSEFKF